MTNSAPAHVTATADGVVIDLKHPGLAAFLAWLIPGAGHLYQGRTAKGLLFMICVLATFYYGMFLGGGRVVYASWTPQDRRLPYLCQIGAGLPALPALIQEERVRMGKAPLFDGIMAPPHEPLGDGTPAEHLETWHKDLNRYFDLGTIFTMVAGLLNILAVYDAFAGPVQPESTPDEPDRSPPKKKEDEPHGS